MGNSVRGRSAPARRPRPPRERRRRPSVSTVLLVTNGALTGVTGVYLATHSVLVTAIAAAAAVILGIILLLAG
jgi:heme A synthase